MRGMAGALRSVRLVLAARHNQCAVCLFRQVWPIAETDQAGIAKAAK
jgi:hypothetical protein